MATTKKRPSTRVRSAIDGRFKPTVEAKRDPRETVTERVKPSKK
jgi:hypothetical protein